MTKKEDTYIIQYKCWNCGTRFNRTISKGVKAFGHGGECLYCGAKDDICYGDDYEQVHTVLLRNL